MFTGIVTHTAKVIAHANGRLVLESPFQRLQIGESIAINGICLTLLPSAVDELMFDISPETYQLTHLDTLTQGDYVNLERALLASDRFSGHYVTGHVDTTCRILSLCQHEEFLEMHVGDFAKPAEAFLVPKGSITLNGVSLTINEVTKNTLKLMLVPHTLANTNLGQVVVGQRLNVEFDYLARIVAHQLAMQSSLLKEV